MVVIRIKENDDNQIPKKINNDDIKIMKNLKLCKLISSDIDEKIEKKIEFIIASKPGNNIEYNNTNDEYTIFGLQQRNDTSDRWNTSRFPPRSQQKSFAAFDRRTTRDNPREKSRGNRFSNWERNDRTNGKNSYRRNQSVER